MTTPADKRADDFRKIHGLVRLLGMDDDSYRAMLLDRYGVTSSKALPALKRNALIASLRKDVAAKARNFSDLKGRASHRATPSQLRAIEAMWAKVSRIPDAKNRKAALRNFVKRLTGVDNLAWIGKADVKTLFAALHAMGATMPEEYNKNNKPKQEVKHG